MTTKNTHGGARRRSGRRTEHPDAAPMARYNVSLDERTLEKLRVVGEGNVSRGIRAAADLAYKHYQESP